MSALAKLRAKRLNQPVQEVENDIKNQLQSNINDNDNNVNIAKTSHNDTNHIQQVNNANNTSTKQLSKSKRNRLKRQHKQNAIKPVLQSNVNSDDNSSLYSGDSSSSDIDDIVDELGIKLNDGNINNNNNKSLNHILTVNTHMLDDNTEAKLKYGIKQNKSHKLRNSITWLNRYKKTYLVKPQESTIDNDNNNNQQRNRQPIVYWPQYHQQMSMTSERIKYNEQLRNQYAHLLITNNDKLFTYKYTQIYDHIEQEYLSVIQMQNPQLISQFVRMYPYHVNGCLALSYLLETQADYNDAQLLIKRALYTLEQSLSADINLFNGCCRLDYETECNKSLYHTLYKHIQMLGKKGLPRTALEYSKVLLSLNPLIDPTCILLSIDYYAIRSQQYKYLIDFVNHYDLSIHNQYIQSTTSPYIQYIETNTVIQGSNSSSNLTQSNIRCPVNYMPNYLCNIALAKYYIEQQSNKKNNNNNTTSNNNNTVYNEYIDILSFTATNYHDLSSSQLLQIAICTVPETINELLQQSNNETKMDTIPFNQLESSFRQYYSNTYTPYLDKLIRVFTCRSAVLYKSNNIIQWLSQNIQVVLDKLQTNQININSFKRLRQKAYSIQTPIYLAELQKPAYTDETPRLPPEMLQQAMQQQQQQDNVIQLNEQQMNDLRQLQAQLQAQQQNNDNNNDEQQLLGNNDDNNNNELQVNLNDNNNPIAAFLRNLLPWFNRNEQLNEDNIHDDDTNSEHNDDNDDNHNNHDQPGFDDRDFVFDEDVEQ